MTVLMGDEKPSLEELSHHGVKGQKWGVRKDKYTSGEIQDARARVGSQVRTINRQIDKTNLSTGKQQTIEAKKLADMQASYLKNPDRATALRMTRGEKWVAGAAAVLLPGVGTAGVAVGVGARVAARKSVEKYLRDQGINP